MICFGFFGFRIVNSKQFVFYVRVELYTVFLRPSRPVHCIFGSQKPWSKPWPKIWSKTWPNISPKIWPKIPEKLAEQTIHRVGFSTKFWRSQNFVNLFLCFLFLISCFCFNRHLLSIKSGPRCLAPNFGQVFDQIFGQVFDQGRKYSFAGSTGVKIQFCKVNGDEKTVFVLVVLRFFLGFSQFFLGFRGDFSVYRICMICLLVGH